MRLSRVSRPVIIAGDHRASVLRENESWQRSTLRVPSCIFWRRAGVRRMRKSLWLVLALLVVGGAQVAHADSFTVSGTATNDSGGSLGSCSSGATCAFSGTLTIDPTSGILTAMDITFPGFTSFTSPQFAEPINTSDFFIGALNSSGDAALTLDFTTTMTPGSLVGFTGGSIFGESVLNNTTAAPEYSDLSGSITPAPAPEPSSPTLIPLGLVALLLMRKRIRPLAV